MGLTSHIILILSALYCGIAIGQDHAYLPYSSSEHIQLIFNQDVYAPGDTAYFKIHYFNDDLSAIEGSHYLKIELVNRSGERHVIQKTMVVNGMGSSQLVIPESLEMGVYTVLAYSNVSNSRVFLKTLTIEHNKRIIPNQDISFFPEGGHLVLNLNHIGVHSIYPKSKIEIFNDTDSLVAVAETGAYGWGEVDLLVMEGENYYANINGGSKRTRLPTISKSGLSIRLYGLEEDANQLDITVSGLLDLTDSQIQIMSNNKIYFDSKFNCKSGEVIVRTVDKDVLSTGMHQLYVLNKKGEILSHRAFFIKTSPAIKTDILMARRRYTQREEVNLEVSLKSTNGIPIEGTFSISVMNLSALGQNRNNSSPRHYSLLDLLNKGSEKSINQYLISQSRRLIVEDQSAVNTSSRYLKKGKAVYSSSGEPLPKGSKLIFYFHNNQQLVLIPLDEGAKFGLAAISDLDGADGLFYVAEDFFGNEISDVRVEWEEDRLIEYVQSSSHVVLDESGVYASFAQKRKLINTSFNVFNKKSKSIVIEANIDRFEKKYITADKIYDMTKYRVFSSMKQTITEIITPLDVIRKKKGYIIRINNLDRTSPNSTPVYIIDGVATKNTDHLLSLTPANLREVRIYRDRIRLKQFGFLGKNGVIWISTKLGNAAPPIGSNNTILGSTKALPFHSVTTMDPRTPHFKSTVYWNPKVSIDIDGVANVQFVTTDDASEYLIKISGIDSNGIYFSTQRILQVGLEE